MSTLLKNIHSSTASLMPGELREVPFQVSSCSDTVLPLVPLCAGFCVPQGQLSCWDDTNGRNGWMVRGFDGGDAVAQAEVLNRWPDGSVRWMLVSVVAPLLNPGRTDCVLVATDEMLNKQAGTGGSLNETDLQLDVRDQHGRSLELKSVSDQTEVCGPVRQVTVQQWEVVGQPFVKLQLRVERWPLAGLQKVEVRIRNSRRAHHRGGLWDLGDAGSWLLQALHLQITDPAVTSTDGMLRWQLSPDTPRQTAPVGEGWQLVQHGSGSENWNSSNHVDSQGRCTVSQRGYEFIQSSIQIHGLRSEPVLQICGSQGSVGVAVPEFWQQFPGSLTCNRGQIDVGLFPQAAGQYFELQGGEQKTRTVWLSMASRNADADSSTLDGSSLHDDAAFMQLSSRLRAPRMRQSRRWIADCRVIDWLPNDDRADGSTVQECEQRFREYLQQATTGRFSVEARREKIDEYGWRHFGDMHADHEQTHFAGPNTIISHYNNQFDLLFGGILNMIVSADDRWFDLFDPLARHVMDIDIYHTDQDRACYNGGLFWHTDHYVDAHTATHRTYSRKNAAGGDYGGGLSCEHNYTTGLLFYHFLTGSPEARDSVLSLADWVIAMDDGSRTVFGLLDSGPSGLASATVSEDFHGPGRGAGNSINALVDAWTLTGSDQYLQKAQELIQRVMHPEQNCDDLHLSDAEGHWSYTVCMTAVGRYLSAKQTAGQYDCAYEYARRTLVNYGLWMAATEQPALKHPERLQYPTEAWAAQEFRKANALRIAAACSPDVDQQQTMRERADQLNDAAWHDLYRFGDQHLTARCLAIVLTEGLRDIFHRSCPAQTMPPAKVSLPHSEWKMFVPQKTRVKQLIKNPRRLLMSGFRMLNPKRILKTLDAVQRQR